MRQKPHFLCAPAQVIGWADRPPETVRPSSSAHDYNCVPDIVTSELHRAQPRRVTKMVLGAPENVQRRSVVAHSPTHPTTWVGAQQRKGAFGRTHGGPAPYGWLTLAVQEVVPSWRRR